MAACKPCGKGAHALMPALTTCEPCPAGSFADSAGTVMCTRCVDTGTTADRGAARLEGCLCDEDARVPPGASPLDAFETQCAAYPLGVSCAATRHPHARQGFWYNVRDRRRPADGFVVCTSLRRRRPGGGQRVRGVAALRERPEAVPAHCSSRGCNLT